MACIKGPEGSKPESVCGDCGAVSTYTSSGTTAVALITGPPPGRLRLPLPQHGPHGVARSSVMGTVTRLRTPARITPLRSRRPPQRDRALDLRLKPGTIVDHPTGHHGEPPCRAVLVERNARNALGVRDEPGVHDWWIIACDAQPECVGTIASFSTIEGARVVAFDRDLLTGIRLADALIWVLRGWNHPGRYAHGGAA